MLSRLKNHFNPIKLVNGVKSNRQGIFIILVIMLIALIFFGLGRLTAPTEEPIQIKNLEEASNILSY